MKKELRSGVVALCNSIVNVVKSSGNRFYGLVFLMISGSVSGQTATYTVASTSTVSNSGTIPIGSSASYSQSFATVSQLTSGNNATLTLNGYAGKKILGIILSMKSNTSGGAGNLNMAAGTGTYPTGYSTIYSIATNNFNNAVWNGAYTTAYTNLNKTLGSSYVVQTNEKIVIRINATANSLYINAFSIIYEDATPTYTLTYNGNGQNSGTVPTDASSPYTSGVTVTVLGNTGSLVKTGYTFSGWNTAADGSGTDRAVASTFSMPTSNTILYAKWTINNYNVTYDGNTNTGGTAPSSQNGDYNTGITVSNEGDLTKTGYTFSGWNTLANGSGTSYATGATYTIPALNSTLYAQWLTNAPFIDPSGTLSALSTIYGTASSITNFTVSGVNLTADILVTAPTGFEVSTTAGSGYNTSTTLAQSGGTVPSTTIYVRLAATTIPGNYSGDIALTSTGAATKNVATVSSTVSTKNLTITGLTGVNKTYDATTAATTTGTATLSGIVGSDDVSLSGTPVLNFAAKTVGTGKKITVTGYTLAGTTAGRYTLTQPTGLTANVTTATLSITGAAAANKTYNGTTAATITGTLSGILLTDTVTLNGTGTFADANAGTGKSVTSTSTLGGADSGNYTLTPPIGLTADVTKITLTATADNKTKATGAVNPTFTITFSGFVNSETTATASGFTAPSATTTATTPSPAGTYPITLTGGTANNYIFNLVNGTLTINDVYSGTGTFVKINSLAELTDGYYVVAYGTTVAMTNTYVSSTYLDQTAITVVSNEVINPAQSLVWKIETNGSGKTIFNEVTSKYVSYTGSSNNIQVVDNVIADNQRWTVSFTSGLFKFTNTAVTARMLQYNTGSPRFAGYPDSQQNLTLYKYTISCASPTTQASSLTATNATTDGFSTNWTAGNGNGTMIVVRPTAQANQNPTSGTTYTPNLAWGSAGQINTNNRVIFRGAGTSAGPITGLTAETQYTVTAYEYNTTDECYNTTSTPTASIYTLSTEPSSSPASFSCNATDYNQISLTFSAASTITNADGYIILQRTGSAPTGLPTDANAYSVGNTIGDATVAAIITNSATTSTTITGLSGNTAYYFSIIPFNWNSSNSGTYNYRTTAVSGSNCTTPNAPSTASNIILSGMAYETNIPYISYQANAPITVTSGTVNVMGISIQDGGGSADTDALPTIVTGITFSSVTGAGMLKAAALFEGSTLIATGTIGANTITFSGLNYSIADGTNKDLTLRVSFNTANITDNTQLTFSVIAANITTASGLTSSQMGAFTTIASSTTGDNNKIEVTADRLAFTTEPGTTSINTNMPSVVVKTVDVNSNVDLDVNSGSVNITSTGTLDTTPKTATVTTGIATFTNINHTVAGTGLTLSATYIGLTGVGSGSFDITEIVYINGDLKTTSGGIWLSASQTATWLEYSSGSWISATAPASNTSKNIYIEHAVETGSSFSNSVNIKILTGGSLTVKYASTANSVYIYDDGTLTIDGQPLTINGNFEIEDGGSFIFDYSANAGATLTNSLWKGIEIFHPNSNFIVKDHKTGSGNYFLPSTSDMTPQTYNGVSAYFGNLIFDYGLISSSTSRLSNGNFNNATVTHNDLIIRSISSSFILTDANLNLTIGGDLIIENTVTSNNISFCTTSSTTTINIKGNLINESSRTLNTVNNATGTNTLNVDGNISVTNTASLNLNAASGGTSTVNLKGDLTIGNSATLTAVSATTFNFDKSNGDGLTDTTTQTVDVFPSVSNINFNVKTGAYTKLISGNLQLGTGSKLTVENNGTLDFGFDNSNNALSVTGTSFESKTGSTLKITSPAGIFLEGTASGNIQTTTRIYATGTPFANYEYIGNANQAVGSGLPASVNNITIENTGANNDNTVTLAQNTTINGNMTINSGIFNINDKTANASSSVSNAVSIADYATLKIEGTNSFPTGYENQTIGANLESMVEYGGSNQVISLLNDPALGYGNLKISGTGEKTLPATEVKVSNKLNVTASLLKVESNKLLTVTNGITTINTPSGSTPTEGIRIENNGNLVQINDVNNASANNNSGNINMERTSRPMKRWDYVYWGAPVKENVLGQLPTEFDYTYQWNLYGTENGSWGSISATAPGKGFITRVKNIAPFNTGTGTIDYNFVGTPNNGTVLVTANSYGQLDISPYTIQVPVDETKNGNTILLSNPYPSAIDGNAFILFNTSSDPNLPKLGGTIYFWTSSTDYNGGQYEFSDYASWNMSGGVGTGPGSPEITALKPTGKIAAGQGFFAQVFSDFDVTFNNTMRLRTTTDNGEFFRPGNTEIDQTIYRHRIWLNLTGAENAFRQTLVGYISSATNDLDVLYDGVCVTSNSINIYSILNEKTLVIQGRALPFEDTDTVPLGYKVTTSGNYTIAIDEVDGLFADDQGIYLEDLELNIVHDLKESAYTFTTLGGTFNNRFVLRYLPAETLGNGDFENIANNVFVAKNNSEISVRSLLEDIKTVTIYDLLGRQIFFKNNINSLAFKANDLTYSQQALIVKVELVNGTIVNRKIIY